MKIIDISWPLSAEITGYKNKQEVIFSALRIYEKESVRESRITLGTHAGTHVDAPAHMLQFGSSIDQLDLNLLIGQAAVLDLTNLESSIDREDLEPFELPRGIILLLKTRNSKLAETAQFNAQFVYLTAQAAQYCAEIGVKAIGIDYLGIERNQPNHETHTILLEKNIPIIEGLRLAPVNAGYYFFICLPLYLVGLEAAPARAILFEDL